ncbi:hypothetical protein BH20VER3_BH20VER3_17210 [soil metagenome]
MSHLPHFADRPHPIGTEANERVRDYLIGALRDLGAEVKIEQTIGLEAQGRFVRAGTVQNILGTLRGSARSRAVMLVAHYDSVPEGPGAADDGAGVSAILEVVRAVRAGPRLRNDLVVLFTDGEEAGLLGSAGFVADHPDLLHQVGLIINLEARGSAGPALMFETSENNGELVKDFAQAAPYPMASSLMVSVYKRMPNDTDLTVLKTTGAEALNFAFIEKSQNYHTQLDTISNLDPRSVQQMGANALGLVRYFGNRPLGEERKPDCIYFNWLGQRPLFLYPVWFGWFLAALTLALCALGSFLPRGRGSARGILAGAGLFFLLFLAMVSGMLFAWRAILVLLGRAFLAGETLGSQCFFAGLVALGLLCGSAVLLAARARFGWHSLGRGLVWMASILAMVVLFVLPGGSYVGQWPAFFGAVSLLFDQRDMRPIARTAWALVSAGPALLVLVPLLYLFFVALGLSNVLMLAAAFLQTLFLTAAWPAVDLLCPSRRRPTRL